MDPNSLINLSELSKPANTLIEKISDAIGGIFKPYQIRRIARAQADSDVIRATAQVEISELQRRALERFMIEEANKQNNIESITSKALPSLEKTSRPEAVEDDWITNFFDRCRLISDQEMQVLWARLLAGEANAPGSFSKRTVDLVASLDKSDAELFTKLCCYCIKLNELTPLIYDANAPIYNSNGIFFPSLAHLESIGLIKFEALAGFIHTGVGKSGYIHYFNEKIWIGFSKDGDNDLQLGSVILTKVGQQLAPISGASAREGFLQYLKEKWEALGYKTDLNRSGT